MRHSSSHTLLVCLLCAFIATSVLSGCGRKQVSISPRPGSGSVPSAPSGPSGGTQLPPGASAFSLTEAERAFRAGDMQRAEQIATALTSRPGLAPADAPAVWRIQALAAAANGHTYLSLSALESWLAAAPGADMADEWQNAWRGAIAALPPYDARNKARAVADDPARPWPLRADMILFLTQEQWRAGDAVGGLTALVDLYNATPDKGQRMRLEHSVFAALHRVEEPALSSLVAVTTLENEAYFPYALILLEDARRYAENPENLEAATAEVAVLRAKTTLADPGIFDAWRQATAPISPVTPLPGRVLALALPLSGQYGALGEKVALGAEIARQEFETAGYDVSLMLIDTEKTGWLDQIAALPDTVTVVGGPLRAQDYSAAREYGLVGSRVFLTFLPTLPGHAAQSGQPGPVVGTGPFAPPFVPPSAPPSATGQFAPAMSDEGGIAWRFFPSPDDQISALLRLTRSLGIANYAVLMPDDAYARRMADLFATHVAASESAIVEQAVYPQDQSEWNRFIGNFLHTGRNATRAPSVGYQAVFLPDSWKNMENLIPNLFYFRETRQVLMGTTLWEQALSVQQFGDPQYYGLAVFPGPWKIKGHSGAAESLRLALARGGQEKAEFWNGLGYDFVRFAATLDIRPGWTPPQVNTLLSSGAFNAWSMAPLHWSAQGKASQDLFLFTPEVDGYTTLDMTTFRRNFEKAWGVGAR